MTLDLFRWLTLAALLAVAAGLLWSWWRGRWEGRRLNGVALLVGAMLLQELERLARGTVLGWALLGAALVVLGAGIVVSVRDARAQWRAEMERVRFL